MGGASIVRTDAGPKVSPTDSAGKALQSVAEVANRRRNYAWRNEADTTSSPKDDKSKT